MDPRLSKKISRLAALALVVVWFAGPLGAVAQGLLLSHPTCHCPGHNHHEPAPPGPAFAPCDHGAAANAAAERFTVLPAVEEPVVQSVAALPIFTPSVYEGPSHLPETPPPKAHA